MQLLTARAGEVDCRGVRCVIVNAWDLSFTSELSGDHFGFGFGAEEICVDRQVTPFEWGQLDLVVLGPGGQRPTSTTLVQSGSA